MTPTKPYLIRGLYEWLLDNETTPYILVDANHEQLSIPPGIARDGKVVLNLAPSAIQQLQITNEYLSFSARFNGIAEEIYCPVASVLAIYARENGQGMMFTDGDNIQPNTDIQPEASGKAKPAGPNLTIVK